MKLIRDITSLLGAVIAFLEPFFRLVDTALLKWVGHPVPGYVSVIICGLLLVPFVLRVGFAVRRTTYPAIRNAAALDVAVGTGMNLPGRGEDLRNLIAELRVMPLVFMVGESGVGKSTLLRHGVFGELQEDNLLLPLLVENRTWIDHPEETLTAVLQSAVAGISSSPAFQGPTSNAEFENVTLALAALSGKIPTLLIDQFETYVDRHRAKLLTDRAVWLSSEELRRQIPFWEKVAHLIAAQKLRALIVIRSDYGDVVPTFQIALSRVFPVNRLERTVVTSRLNQLEDAQFVENAKNVYWRDLREVIESDFEQMGGYVLPIQLELALRGLPYLKPLTSRAYRKGGGISGLEARVALTRVETASIEHRVPVLVLLASLKRLFNPATAISAPHSTEMLREIVAPEIELPTLRAALDRLRELKLLRLQTGVRPDETSWSLTHSYLYYALARAERQVLAKSLSLTERDRQRIQGANIVQCWRALLWPHEVLAALWGWLRGQNHADQHTTLLAWSSLKLVPFVVAVLTPFVIADISDAMPGHRALRSWMDVIGISIFRPVYSRQDVNVAIDRDIKQLAAALSQQRDVNGWFRTRFNRPVPLEKDYWAHAQTLAILSDRELSDDQEVLRLVDGLDILYSDVFADAAGKIAGWPRSSIAEVNYARAEPALWSGIALARLLQQRDRLPTDKVDSLERRLRALEQISANYLVPSTGGWNRFAAQVDSDATVSSTYVTALALLMLLELRDADASFSVGPYHRELLIGKTTQWLLDNSVENQGRHVWRDNPIDDAEPMSESLSLQVYYVVGRSMLSAGKPADSEIWNDTVSYLRHALRSEEPSEAIGHIQRRIKTLQGHVTATDATISFMYRPWVLASASHVLLRGCGESVGRIATSDVFQNAARTMMAQSSVDFTADNQFLFPAAEWLLGLQELRDALADVSGCQ